jgi:hypothetical protein
MRRAVARLSNIVLITGAVSAVTFLIHDLYEYGWVGWRPFMASRVFPEELCLVAVGAVLLGSLRLRTPSKTALAAMCVGVAAAMYTEEFALAHLTPDQTPTPFWSIVPAHSRARYEKTARSVGIQFDTRDPAEVRDSLRMKGFDAINAAMIGGIVATGGLASDESHDRVLLPLGGVADKLTVLCNELGQYVSYMSDEHGFRNPPDVWRAPEANLAVVGESFAQEYCVPDGQGFVDLLRTRFPVTLNLGISGQSALLQLAAIKEYLPRYAPQVVLWIFCENIDIYDIGAESANAIASRYLEPGFTQHLFARQAEIDRALQRFLAIDDPPTRLMSTPPTGIGIREPLWDIVKLWQVRERLNLFYGVNSAADARTWSLLEEQRDRLLRVSLEQAHTIARSWGGTLYFVYLPSWTRYRNGPRASEGEHARVIQLVTALKIPLIDIEPHFRAHSDPLSLFPFRKFGHYNEAGNRLVADVILRFFGSHE